MSLERPLESLSDDELLRGLAHLLGQSRRVEADLVAHIAEVETRRLYAREASPSMFVYCTNVLHLSEAEAYLRITAARAARENPPLLAMLADGRLHLSGIAKLAPHLTRENRDSLLSRAVHKSGHDPDNICLMCPLHNRYLAELDYGKKALSRHWGTAQETRRPAETRLRIDSQGL
jgi:hypothetical protein